MGAVAQYDKSQIVPKLRGARMRKRAKEDPCEGRKPFGCYLAGVYKLSASGRAGIDAGFSARPAIN